MNEQQVDSYIKHLDEKFKLVFTLDKFMETLVHLKRSFGWDMKDILHMANNRGRSMEMPTEREDMNMMVETNKKISWADYRMYDYFSQKLGKILANYGADFQQEVEYFADLNSNVSSTCQQALTDFRHNKDKMKTDRAQLLSKLREIVLRIPTTRWHRSFSVSLTTCRLMQIDTLHYQNAIRVRQFPATCDPKAGPPFVREPKHKNHQIGDEWCAKDTGDIYNFSLELFSK